MILEIKRCKFRCNWIVKQIIIYYSVRIFELKLFFFPTCAAVDLKATNYELARLQERVTQSERMLSTIVSGRRRSSGW